MGGKGCGRMQRRHGRHHWREDAQGTHGMHGTHVREMRQGNDGNGGEGMTGNVGNDGKGSDGLLHGTQWLRANKLPQGRCHLCNCNDVRCQCHKTRLHTC